MAQSETQKTEPDREYVIGAKRCRDGKETLQPQKCGGNGQKAGQQERERVDCCAVNKDLNF